MKELLTGVLPVLVTFLDGEGRMKTELAKSLVDMYVKQGAAGLYMFGWTGEGVDLNVEKRKIWAQAVLEAGREQLSIFVHVGYNENLDDSVELAAHMERYGTYAVASVGISESTSLQDNADYFKRIAQAAPGTSFYIYWVAGGKMLTVGKSIGPDELLKAMKAVPTFRGIKLADNNFYIPERSKKYWSDLNILTGADELTVCSQTTGADGNIGVFRAVTCYHHKQIFECVQAGDHKRVRELQYCADEVAEAYNRPEIGNLPRTKSLLERIYGIKAGICSSEGLFVGYEVPEDAAKQLVEVFRKNIMIAEQETGRQQQMIPLQR